LFCIITRADRQAADVEFVFAFRVKEGMKDFMSLLLIQVGQGHITKLIEAAAKSFYKLMLFTCEL
jgi:hypothetical protein